MAGIALSSQQPTTAVFSTGLGHGQSVKFSPFNGNRLAVSCGSDYGLTGQGFLYVLERNEVGVLEELQKIDYRDNLLDMCWSETDPNILATSSGDGFIQVYNLGNKYPKVPIHEFKGHRKEMSSLDWSLPKFSNTILAGSWDGTVSAYDLTSPWPLLKMTVSDLIVYQAVWSPHSQNTYISAAKKLLLHSMNFKFRKNPLGGSRGDGVMQLWDLNSNNQKPQIYLSASDNELLTCDWSKYSPNIVATAGSDSVIRGWDLRNYQLPIFTLEDHGHAVKRIKFSPFHATMLGSVGYDFTLRIFDYHVSDINLEIVNQHEEFVYGLDWNLHVKNEIATCAWDKTVKLCVPLCLRGV